MKKAINLALICLLFGLLAQTARAEAPHKIYLVTWRGCEDACRGFQDYFDQEGIAAEFILRDAGRDKTKLAGFVAEAKELDVDLVVTWGTSTALGVIGKHDEADPARHVTDRPAVFMIVSQPIGAGIVPSFDSSERNVAGTQYLVNEETQLRVAGSYKPFDRLGVIYNPAEPNSTINVERLRKQAEEKGFELVDRPVPNGEDGKPDPESIPGLVKEIADAGADWLYQGPDSFLNVNRDMLTDSAIAVGLPVFAAGEAPVRTSGALLGVVNRYYNVGQFTAHKARRILVDGVAPQDIAIESPARLSLIINMAVARKLGLFPPMSMLTFAEVIDNAGN